MSESQIQIQIQGSNEEVVERELGGGEGGKLESERERETSECSLEDGRTSNGGGKRRRKDSKGEGECEMNLRMTSGIRVNRSRIRLCAGRVPKGRLCNPEISVETAVGEVKGSAASSSGSTRKRCFEGLEMSTSNLKSAAAAAARSSSVPIHIPPTNIASSSSSPSNQDSTEKKSDWSHARTHGRTRSNSQPLTSLEFESLSPLSAVLDRAGSEWLERLNELRSDGDRSESNTGRNAEVLDMEQQMSSDAHWADIIVRNFAYERPSGCHVDSEGGIDTSGIVDDDSIFGTSPPPVVEFGSPCRSDAYKNTFAVKRGVGSHIFAILQRLREGEASHHGEEASTSESHFAVNNQPQEASRDDTPSPDPAHAYVEVEDEWPRCPSPSFTATESGDDSAWTESEKAFNNDSESEIMSLSSSVETYKYWR